jgi:hypothetical protein
VRYIFLKPGFTLSTLPKNAIDMGPVGVGCPSPGYFKISKLIKEGNIQNNIYN